MPWCPKCKNEYRQGIKMCADCHVELVEQEELISQVALCGGPAEMMYSLKEYLEYNKFKNVNVKLDEKQKIYALFVDEKDANSAQTLAKVFLEQQMLQRQQAEMQAKQQMFAAQAAASEAAREAGKTAQAGANGGKGGYQGGYVFGSGYQQAPVQTAMQDGERTVSREGLPSQLPEQNKKEQTDEQSTDAPQQAPQIARRSTPGRFVDSADRAEDNRSSAWTLLIVGGLGLIVMILGIAGVLPFNVGNPYMFYGVMSAVFILFLVMGVVSFKNAKVFDEKAESENSLKDTLLQWAEENLTAEKVDMQLRMMGINEVAEEEMYFRRYEMIKFMMNHQFMNLDQAFLEKLIDDTVYDMVFGEEE